MNTIAAADRTHPRRAEWALALLVGPAGTAVFMDGCAGGGVGKGGGEGGAGGPAGTAVFMDGCGGGVGKGGRGEGGAGAGELQAFVVHRLTVPGTVA